MFYTRGRHALKFGTLINRYQRVSVSGTGGRGSISFLSLTNFLLAQSNRISALTPGSLRLRTVHHHTLGFYVQDAMRVRPNFTLNLGLRYEFHTELKEPRGRATAIRDIRNDPEPTLGRLMENPSLGNISPRFGFAWDVTGNAQTAVRGGFGLLYDIAAVGTAMVQSVRTPPFSTNSQVRDPETFTLPFIFPPESAGLSMSTTDYRIQQPHLLQYHLTVERQLPYQMAMTLAYGGFARDQPPADPRWQSPRSRNSSRRPEALARKRHKMLPDKPALGFGKLFYRWVEFLVQFVTIQPDQAIEQGVAVSEFLHLGEGTRQHARSIDH